MKLRMLLRSIWTRPHFIACQLTRHKTTKSTFLICFGIAVFLWNSANVSALDYSDFPENLQWILDDRIEELGNKGVTCVAGRVTFSDGAQIYDCGDVSVSLTATVNEPLTVYYGGWFIMRRILDAKWGGPNKRVVFRAFDYDPNDVYVTIDEGRITYLETKMTKTPDEKLCDIKGVVFDENANPLEGATVSLSFPLTHFPESELRIVTNSAGEYIFDKVTETKYTLKARAGGYADSEENNFGLSPNLDRDINLRLYPHQRIYIEYVYEPNDTRNFDSDSPNKAMYWKHDNNVAKGLLFSDGVLTKYENDLVLRQGRDALYFTNYYGTSGFSNGHYDEGLVDFSSVSTAAEDPSKYKMGYLDCKIGHVYVVKTLEGPRYAKFIVLTGEYSFRTVNPANLKPYQFPGYGLDVEVSSCSGVGKVYVSKFYDAPEGLDIHYLPYYWEISGLEGLEFKADLTFKYSEQDIKKLNIPEDSLVVLQFDESNDEWRKVSSSRDTKRNKLFVENIDTCGLFSVGAY